MSRAVFLVVMMMAGTLIGIVPTASAQESPFICFDGESPQGDSVPFGSCRFGSYEPANYMQGDIVHIRIQNLDGQTPYVRVRCLENCHGYDASYYARWRSEGLRFPQDFNNDRGPDGDGNLTGPDRVPRYNSSWETSVLLSETDQLNPKRTFNVWLISAYRSENMTIRPGERHFIRSNGLDSRAPVEMLIQRRLPDGRQVDVLSVNSTAGPDGTFRYDWVVPKDEWTRMKMCEQRTSDCYRLRLTSVGKDVELITFGVGPANIVMTPIVGQASSTLQRTQHALLVYGINYPGGAYREGPKLDPGDLPESVANPDRGIRVIIEKINSTNDENPQYYGDARMFYVPTRFAWELNWTVPRDLPLGSNLNPDESMYRLRLPTTRDAWGNKIDGRVLANYTIQPATLTPVLVESPGKLGRTDEGRFVFRVAYHNGSLLGPEENKTGLRGCIVRDTSVLRSDCPAADIRWASHDDDQDRWVYTHRFPRDYPHVDDTGRHRLFLLDGFQDQWGNRVDGRTGDSPRAYVSDAFTAIPGSPRINFTTTQRGDDAQTLVRGHRVAVQATITYGDGQPFNHTHMENESRTLNVTLTRRGPSGAIQHEGPVTLQETDAWSGRWIGDFELTRDDTEAPAGRWTFTVEVEDNLTAPNFNRTTFDRYVSEALIQLHPTFQPPANLPIGSNVKFRFRLLFDDGRAVPQSSVYGALEAWVYRYDRVAKALVGEPVSGLLEPLQVPNSDEFSIDWKLPNHLFAGDYVIVVRGGDMYGNRMHDDTWSRPFSTFADTRLRSVLVEPQPLVKRGESATVVFDGQEGDVGGPAIGVPAVRLERWDSVTQSWVIERQTTRIADASTSDHIGVVPITTNTVIGVYRFRLEGRDETFNIIHAVSRNFTIQPTTVQRAVYEAPPTQVVKGEGIQFAIEQRNGDRIMGAEVLFNGRPVELQRPIMTSWGDHINITFVVPYEAQTGNYSVRVTGRDLYGNTLEVISPPVEVLPASLEGKIIGNPTRVVQRGEAASILFGITNPDGGFYFASEVPLVEVHNGTGHVATADVVRDGLTFRATWTPDERTEETEYLFIVSGTGVGGNTFPTLRSQPFRVAPGELTRSPVADVGVENLRNGFVTFAIPFEPDDEFVAFKLGYFGPSYDVAPALFETRDPTTLTTLPHTIDVEAGRYVARFVTDHTTSIGAYRIYMEGRDRYGNDLVAQSKVFLLKPTNILITWDAAPPDSTFGEGKTYTRSFVARYREGTIMTEQHGAPQVALLYDDLLGSGRRPVAQRPEVTYRQDRWFISWSGPEVMPDGSYTFTVGGTDVAGNAISGSTANDIILQRKVDESMGLFLKEVPSPPPALALLVLLAVALLGRTWRARR